MINFHDPRNKNIYTERSVDKNWLNLVQRFIMDKPLDHAADIGCGGGIYTQALAETGFKKVQGVDFSETMIRAAKRMNLGANNKIDFHLGSADNTGLLSNHYNFVLQRALIHHLDDLHSTFSEANRVLKKEGTLLVQDRTPNDCFLEGSLSHLRGYIFSFYPHLREIEEKRRYNGEKVKAALYEAGFSMIAEMTLWETKQRYFSKKDLLLDLRSRKGRSILFELTNLELDKFILFIDEKLKEDVEIVDKDRWTIWTAVK